MTLLYTKFNDFSSSDVKISTLLRHQNFGATSYGTPSQRREFTTTASLLITFVGI